MSRFCLFVYLQFVKFALLCLVVIACFVSSTDSILHLQVHLYLIQLCHMTPEEQVRDCRISKCHE